MLDLIDSELERWSDQQGMKEVVARADILVNSVNRKFSSEDMSKLQLSSGIEKSRLTMERTLLGN